MKVVKVYLMFLPYLALGIVIFLQYNHIRQLKLEKAVLNQQIAILAKQNRELGGTR